MTASTIDLRPIVYLLGRILIVLAIVMLIPAIVDYRAGLHNGVDFLQCAVVTGGLGAMLSIATADGIGRGLNIRQAYLLTITIWTIVPLFGALPFMLGAPHLSFTDAYFEAVSGITTTGSTVIVGLDSLPNGTNLWRGLLHGLGGLGIAFVAMIFLPVMRVGGMQFFKTEGFDTLGKSRSRATDIARHLVLVYFGLIGLCIGVYASIGMSPIDAVVHGLSTIATGGFSTTNISFNKYSGAGEYAGALFMILGSLPYVRYVQLITGSALPLWRDSQSRAFIRWLLVAVLMVSAWRVVTSDMGFEPAFRVSLFNLTSLLSGTGFSSGSFSTWGGFILVVAFVLGVVGGCSGSSCGALSIFRVQVMLAAIAAHFRQIANPSRVAPIKYAGRLVDDDVMSSIVLFSVGFIVTLGLASIALNLLDVDLTSAVFGVWASIGNTGYGLGPLIERTGTFVDFPDAAKWVLIVLMLMGRLSLLAIFVVAMPRFWRD